VTRAALQIVRGEEAKARETLGAAATAERSVDDLMQLASRAADQIRPLLQAIQSQPASPFDLSAPGTGNAPGTEPSLQMPGLLRDRPPSGSGLGQGLQLRL